MNECQHSHGRILTYDCAPYRWVEQCTECKSLAVVTMDNHVMRLPLPSPVSASGDSHG